MECGWRLCNQSSRHRRWQILPEGGLLDEKYRDMTADEIYTTLQQNGGAEALSGLSEFDGTCVQPNPSLADSGAQSKHEADMRVAVQQAAESAKAQGKLPGSLSKLVDDIVSPKVNWKQKLARFLKSNNKSDYSWQKPNRRFVAGGLYLPSLYSPCIEEVGVIVDTSASRTDEELNQDLGEISSMLVDANVENVRFMQADTDVTDEQTFTRESMPQGHNEGPWWYSLWVSYRENGREISKCLLPYLSYRLAGKRLWSATTLSSCLDN